MPAPFFIVGPPKTGTTVLTRLVVQHPEITCISESYVLEPQHSASIAQPEGGKWAAHGFTREDAERWQTSFRGHDRPTALREVLDDAWSQMTDATGTSVVGDSWPMYGLHLPTVKAAFPDARFVYTTRDPRAVYWSGETFKGRAQGAWNSALLLRIDRAARSFFASHDMFVVRYEELIAQPKAVMTALWEYLGVDPAPGWIEYQPDRDPWPERWSWIPNATRTLDPTRTSRWETEMPPEAQRIASLASAEYCEVWDYPLRLDSGYRDDEFLAAFLAGATLTHLPDTVEDMVRAEFAVTKMALRERSASLNVGTF